MIASINPAIARKKDRHWISLKIVDHDAVERCCYKNWWVEKIDI